MRIIKMISDRLFSQVDITEVSQLEFVRNVVRKSLSVILGSEIWGTELFVISPGAKIVDNEYGICLHKV